MGYQKGLAIKICIFTRQGDYEMLRVHTTRAAIVSFRNTAGRVLLPQKCRTTSDL